jgi:fermentation-respiration switch protein FrsA (DUF1100 family)
MRIVVALAILTTGLVACASGLVSPPAGSAIEFDRSVRLHDHALTVHLTAGQPHSVPLIVYATGDAGWWGKDKDIFRALAAWGYPVAGVSSREYVHHLDAGDTMLQPSQVASDFSAVVAVADTALGLPTSTPVVLVGKSRGAGLAVAAGTASRLGGRLLGILAVGLTGEEEYVAAGHGQDAQHNSADPLHTYQMLPTIGRTPIAVIQSTNDEYVPAAEARELFGPDTSSRRLYVIEADNHNFGNALPALYADMARSFAWIIQK